MTEQAPLKRERCPRCNGRMMSVGTEGDLACFSCGHHKYNTEPLPITQGPSRRRPSHGGHSLS